MVMVSGGSRISPRRGCQLSRGVPTYEFAKFSQKLHELKEFGPQGGACPKFYYVDLPLMMVSLLQLHDQVKLCNAFQVPVQSRYLISNEA